MPIIPTSRGNPQASDIAVEAVLPMTGNASRQDAQSTLAQNDAEVSKLFEDRNAQLSQGGLISFSGTQLTFTENLTLEINSQVAGGSPTVISLGMGPYNVPASGDMVYAVINRTLGTAVVTDSATSLPAVNASNQEVFLIGKRNDAADLTMRFYFRDGTAMNAGQTIRLGAPTGTITPAGLIQMYGGVTPPTGYLLCDGTAYLIATYPSLAASLFDSGTGNYAYGSPDAGATQFNVPDFRGLFPRGVDNGAGRDPDAASRSNLYANGNTGDNVGSHEAQSFETHQHSIDPNNDDMQILTTNSGAFGFTGGTGAVFIGRTGGAPVTGQFGSETRPENLYVNFIIKF